MDTKLTVFQVEEARLTHVLELAARLADLGLLVAHARARTPAEHGERSCAYLALFAVFLLHHAYVRVVAQTRLAQDGKVLETSVIKQKMKRCLS